MHCFRREEGVVSSKENLQLHPTSFPHSSYQSRCNQTEAHLTVLLITLPLTSTPELRSGSELGPDLVAVSRNHGTGECVLCSKVLCSIHRFWEPSRNELPTVLHPNWCWPVLWWIKEHLVCVCVTDRSRRCWLKGNECWCVKMLNTCRELHEKKNKKKKNTEKTAAAFFSHRTQSQPFPLQPHSGSQVT